MIVNDADIEELTKQLADVTVERNRYRRWYDEERARSQRIINAIAPAVWALSQRFDALKSVIWYAAHTDPSSFDWQNIVAPKMEAALAAEKPTFSIRLDDHPVSS